MIKFCFPALLCTLFAAPASALPALATASDTADDAQITLTVADQVIVGDSRSYCDVRIQVGQTDVELRQGDTVRVQVFEHDVFSFNDEIFDIVFSVTAAEAQGGVDRTFDCSGDFVGDNDDSYELFAKGEVQKDGCGLGCFYDRPTTDILTLEAREDDEFESNNSAASATVIGLGSSAGYIARDPDWYAVVVDSPAVITLIVPHRPRAGRIAVALYRDTEFLAQGVDTDDGAHLKFEPLAAGTYGIEIVPKDELDFVAYGLNLDVEPTSGGGCSGGESETISCGNCGFKSRSCVNGVWAEFTNCGGEGVCAPGEQESSTCGGCGTRIARCSSSCTWVEGSCNDSCANASAALGEPCAGDGACIAGLECLQPPSDAAFTEGYCSTSGCSDDSECVPEALCGAAFGSTYCLRRCTEQLDCRLGYQCVDFEGANACLPVCAADSICEDRALPVCDQDSGLCVAGDGTGGGISSRGGGLERGEGCASVPGAGYAFLALAGLGIGLLRRRRR